MPEERGKPRGEILERPKPETQEPPAYKVLLHNDDYTTMDFVLEILESIFDRSPAESYGIMMKIHTTGLGVAGLYPHEIAETKVGMVHDRAHKAGFPLKASLEKD